MFKKKMVFSLKVFFIWTLSFDYSLAKADNFAFVDPLNEVPVVPKERALKFFQNNPSVIKNKNFIVVVDFTFKASRKRFFVLDMNSGAVDVHIVPNSEGSDPNNSGWAWRFGNSENRTSLGFYLTGSTYNSALGLTLKLDGKSPTNSLARKRFITVYGSRWVDESSEDLPGRSKGAFVLDDDISSSVIQKIKNGALIYAYGNQKESDDYFGAPDWETKQWRNILTQHGGTVVIPETYPFTIEGFEQYIKDSGVTRFSGRKMVSPYNPSAARRCGLSHLMPSYSWWPRGAALAMWMEKASNVAGETPFFRNWYRPSCYNSAVGGASSSDHIQARAIDVDFSSTSARRKAQLWMCNQWRSSLNMQVGLGGRAIHLGAMSPKGKRNWYYSSYKDRDKFNTCFD